MDLSKFDKYLSNKEEGEKVDEADLKYERSMQKKIATTCDKAQDAFWAVVVNEFKDAESKEIDPYTVQEFARACERVIMNWTSRNIKRPNTVA
jgi:hypothetical protein